MPWPELGITCNARLWEKSSRARRPFLKTTLTLILQCGDRIFHRGENKNGVRQQKRSGNYQISTPSDPIDALPPLWRRILGSSNQKPRQNFWWASRDNQCTDITDRSGVCPSSKSVCLVWADRSSSALRKGPKKKKRSTLHNKHSVALIWLPTRIRRFASSDLASSGWQSCSCDGHGSRKGGLLSRRE